MKKIVFFLVIMLSILGVSYAATESTIALMNRNVKIQYEGNLQEFQNVLGVRVYPLTYEGTTYLPIRAISSLFHSRIKWDGVNNSIYLGEGELDTTSARIAGGYLGGINEDITVLLNGDVKIYYQGKVQTFRDANGKIVYPLSYEGTTYLPVRAISNLFNLEIGWNAGSNTVSIHKQGTEVAVYAVNLNKTMLSLKEGESETLTAIITPTNATNQNVLWTSSNTNVAIVKAGRVNAVKEGVATITATTVEGEKQATCKVTVTSNGETVPIESIALNKEAMTIEEGKSEMLTATVKPSNATNKSVIWSSSNTSVATVSNGTVKAIKAGTAVITAKTVDGNKVASCNVTVKTATTTPVAVTGIQLNKTSMSLEIGKIETLTATITPTNATNQNIIWSSSNTNVAIVSNGKVTGLKEGIANIIVSTEDGGKKANCVVMVKGAASQVVAVTGVQLNKTSMSLEVGKSETLMATITPTNATNQNVTWSSSNTSIATVSNGTVKAIKTGTAIITVKTADGNKTANCKVTIKTSTPAPVAVTGVQLNKTSMSLQVGQSGTLVATITPTNATNQNVTWSSSNTGVATVSNGTVKAIKTGTAVIIVKTADGNKVASCNVTVKTATTTPVAVTGVQLNKTSMNLEVGKTEMLTATITPTNATNKNVTWSSSNTSIATVSNGIVKAIKAGTTIITAKTSDENKTASCIVMVKTATVGVTGIKLNKTSMSLQVGQSETLIATITPTNATNKNVTWSSSNTNVVTVSNGKVTAKNVGKTNVIATAANGISKTCEVIVSKESAIFFGDSITRGVNAYYPKKGYYSWVDYISEKYGLNTTNAGIGGWQIGGKDKALYTTIQKYAGNNYTYVILHGGCNDISKNRKLGKYDKNDYSGNYDYNTFLGGLETYLYKATKTWPNAKIGYIITYKTPNDKARETKKSRPYYNAMKEVLNKWKIPYIDLFDGKTSDGKRYSEDILKVSSNKYLCDNLHLRKEGYNVISPYIYQWMQTLPNYQLNQIAVSGVKLNKTSVNLKVGKEETLTATITPTNATNKSVTWNSSNTSIATVSNGKVTAKKAGTAIITVKTVDGGKSASCTITIKDVKYVAHRGASNQAPENTVLAFQKAVDLKAYAIETDIQVTKDGYLVCCHNSTVDSTTNGKGTISKMTLSQIRKLKIKKNTSLKIPTFEEYIEVCKKGNCIAQIELKTKNKTAIKKVLKTINDYGMKDKCMIISFDDASISYVRELDSSIKIGLILNNSSKLKEYIDKAAKLKKCIVVSNKSILSQKWIDYAHNKNVEIDVWTVDTKSEKEKWSSLGVDYITTNILT